MKTMMRNTQGGARMLAVALLVSIGLLGALAGVAADRMLLASPTPAATVVEDRERCGSDGRGFGYHRNDDHFHERMAEELELSEAQQARVAEILDDRKAQMREVMSGVRPRMREIAKETREEVEAVLTTEQWERLRELHEDEDRDGS